MEARASAKYLRGSAQKARLVVDMIRGKSVGEALAILRFTQKRAAESIEKCLRSAIANATEAAERQNVAVDPDDLFVKACFVDMGPTKHRRRVRPAPQGRAYREQRHFCHVTVLVSSDGSEEAPAGRGKKAARGGQIDPNGERKTSKKAAASAPPKKRAEQKTAEQPAAEAAAPETTE
ncbi:MAG: 50S ribosomal protein L22 [Acidobacteriota bacterium]|nr:50S ribosomal protein L22 [Acidobacteriota bacterium]